MNEIDLTNISFSLSRKDVRKKIITIFLQEEPGTGKKELSTKYNYITKKLADGRKVYLSRPAQFNNGFDFTVNVSDTNFNEHLDKRSTTRPTHQHIIKDLELKKNTDFKSYKELLKQIKLVYKCKDYIPVSTQLTSGHPTELILECIRWLFIEQDVTYWNYSGRTMLYNLILDV